MQVVLVMFRNDGERRSFSVVRNMTVIGRREDCDLRIPVGDVSRKHCRMVLTDDGIRIEDLGSSNGTFVNSDRIQECDLNAGDVIGIGPVQFIVQIDGVPNEEEMISPKATPAAPAYDDEDSIIGSAMPRDEMTIDDSATGEAPAEEEFQIEDEPGEAASSAGGRVSPEMSSEDSSLAEFPLEEAPAGELPVAESTEDEIPLEELPTEEIVEKSPVPVSPVAAESAETIAAPAFALDPVEELTALPELEMSDDEPLEENAAPISAASAPTEEPIEEVNLDGDEAATTDEIEPVDLDANGESDWDFVVEESDNTRNDNDFQIDLDSPHGQAHGQA